jgi:two-component system sensor histidine kinase UhpB
VTLRRQLLLGVASAGAVAGAIGVGVATLQSRVDRAEVTHALTLALVEGASQAQALAVEYRLAPDSQVANRLRTQLASLRVLQDSLPVPKRAQAAQWAALRRDLARVDTVLTALHEWELTAAADDAGAQHGLLRQLIGESRLAVSDAATLSRVEHAAQERSEADLRRLVVAALVGLGGVSVALAWWFTRGVSRRLEALQESAVAWAGGDFSHRAPVDRADEIGALAAGFNTMAEELDGIWRQLRLEVDERGRVVEGLERRARQQTCVAHFGARALEDLPLDVLREDAVATVAEGLGVEFGALTKPLANPSDGFSVVATVGWPTSVRGSLLPPGTGSQSGFTVTHGGPVVTDDLASERRFTVPGWTIDLGMHSGISVIVGEPGVVRGVLLGHSRGVHSFTEDDIAFMESVASVLAQALENRKTTERLRLALSSANQGLWELNVQTGRAVLSPEYCRLLGYQPSELNFGNAQWGDYVHPTDMAGVSQVYADYLAGRVPIYTVEYRQRTKAGAWRWLLSVGKVVEWDQDGRPLRMLGICTDIHERKLGEEELRESREQLRQLALAQERAREAERTQIARELHDELGSALTGLKMDVSWLLGRLPPDADADRARAEETLTLINGTVDVVRRMSADLRPGVLDDLGLGSAIRWLAAQFGNRAGLEITTTGLDDLPDTITGDRATAVFRILQEALTNVARHAQATAVEISAWTDEGILRLEVRDDGRGYVPRPPGGRVSLGILGMQERAAAWDGDVTVAPAPNGTVVLLQMPVPTAEPPA